MGVTAFRGTALSPNFHDADRRITMTTFKRLLALLMALAMCFALAACKDTGDADPDTTDSDPSGSVSPDPSADPSSDIEVDLSQNLYEFASGLDPNATAVTVNGTAIPNEIFLYWLASDCDTLYSYYQNYYIYYGMTLDFSDPDTVEYLLSSAQSVTVYAAVLRELCEQNGVAITDEQQAELQEQIDLFTETYGEDNYRNLVASYGSEDTFQYINTNSYLYSNLADALVGEPTDADLEQYVADNGIFSVKHILLMTTADDVTDDDGNVTQTADEYNAAQKELAEDLLAQLQASDDTETLFDTLMNEYSEDSGLASNPDGYTFDATSSLVGGFREATLELEPGQMSGIVETDFGYHILLRLPVDAGAYHDDWIEDSADSLITEAMDAAEITVSEDLGELDLGSFYDRFLAYANILFADMTAAD